jgi:hypothetical protein
MSARGMLWNRAGQWAPASVSFERMVAILQARMIVIKSKIRITLRAEYGP